MTSLARHCAPLLGAWLLLTGATAVTSARHARPLGLSVSADVFTAPADRFGVTATMIVGPTESLLIDTTYFNSDARAVADRIASTGTHLKAILLTHPDDDHYLGTGVMHERFPTVPIYISAAGLKEFQRTSARQLAGMRQFAPNETPEALPMPEPFPSNHFRVDGVDVEVIPDLQGDVTAPTNSIIWVPSIRTVIAGDVVFNGVHVWLADSTPETRRDWRRSLDRVAALSPARVITGHKGQASLAESPSSIGFTRDYLLAFDEEQARTTTADDLIAAMKRRYPGLGNEWFLMKAARHAHGS
jgi:glyoxylase-like metal-dependent hydrolase (beta-lactamase superfamily II)